MPTKLSPGDVQAHSVEVPAWTLEGASLRRTFRTENFRAALAFINRVGMLAEEEEHHPDFHLTNWNQVELVLSTHDVGGLSLSDFSVAKKIDALAKKDGLA